MEKQKSIEEKIMDLETEFDRSFSLAISCLRDKEIDNCHYNLARAAGIKQSLHVLRGEQILKGIYGSD